MLQACLNGSRDGSEHAAIPITAGELASAAQRAVAAGAEEVHVHPRLPDGRETLDSASCGAAVVALRRACKGIPIGLTTGLWIVGDVDVRLACVRSWRALPDFVSVNFSEDGAEDLVDLALGLGMAVEAGLSGPADATRLMNSGLERRCLRLLVEIDDEVDPTASVARARDIDQVLDDGGASSPRLHHGHGRATWAVIERALDCGHQIRVGLEDTLVLPDGKPAEDNADLIATAAAMVGTRRPVS